MAARGRIARGRLAQLLAVSLVTAVAGAACASQPASPSRQLPSRRAPHAATPTFPAGVGVVSQSLPRCTTAVATGPALPASATAMTTVRQPASRPSAPLALPFGVAVSADGSWGFASAGASVSVLRLAAGRAPVLEQSVAVPAAPAAGVTLSPDGRLLLVADGGSGAVVLSVAAAESGTDAILGTLSAPGARLGGAIEVAVSPDGRYAFVSLEDDERIAVFNLAAALAHGFGRSSYVGSIPTQIAPVGLAFAPDGRWLYSTSEARTMGSQAGTLEVIDVARAESDPARSVVARVPAGCNPVRVTTSANGAVVWVTARASDALLAFSASALRSRPRSALLADVAVGEAPVGLAVASGGALIVVADSDRFNVPGRHASLAIVDTSDALAGRPALLGYLPAGTFPRDVAANASGSTVLVANFESSQVESVDVADLR